MKIYIKENVGRSIVKGTTRSMPRQTIKDISEEIGSADWFEEIVTASKGAAIREQAKAAGENGKYKPGKEKQNTHANPKKIPKLIAAERRQKEAERVALVAQEARRVA